MSEQPKVIFADEGKKHTFEDLQPKVIFADESRRLISRKLVLDIIEVRGSYNLDYNFDYE